MNGERKARVKNGVCAEPSRAGPSGVCVIWREMKRNIKIAAFFGSHIWFAHLFEPRNGARTRVRLLSLRLPFVPSTFSLSANAAAAAAMCYFKPRDCAIDLVFFSRISYQHGESNFMCVRFQFRSLAASAPLLHMRQGTQHIRRECSLNLFTHSRYA